MKRNNIFNILGVIISVLVLITVVTGGLMPDYSNGTRTGEIIKFSNKGIIIKSNEGQMLLGGLNRSGDTLAANTWNFSVQDPVVLKKIQESIKKKTKVTLEYKQYLIKPITIDSDYVITSVKEE